MDLSFTAFILVILLIIVTRKIWNSWMKVQAESAEIWVKDQEVDLQDRMADVSKRQHDAISQNGKWFTMADLEQPKSTKPDTPKE